MDKVNNGKPVLNLNLGQITVADNGAVGPSEAKKELLQLVLKSLGTDHNIINWRVEGAP